MAHKANPKDIDPEELLRRKFQAKCRFRALGRLCMANTFWLKDAIDTYEGDDVKRRVEQAVRGKVKKQLLSVKDKALLNKQANDRTEHEKKYLYRIIGGLKCFKRYPNHVRRKLAEVTYFQYYGPNRVVVRQHQEAHALFFIVGGTVSVTQLIYDELLEEFVSQEISTMEAGDMFGEISMLHSAPRTATVTTTDHCEFLQLLKADFKNVLQVSVQRQWDEVKVAMSSFTYFDALNEMSLRECCIVAKIKHYVENDTVLGDGVGVANHVYFIISGHVQMIERLQVIVVNRLGKEYYTLFDPYLSPEPSDDDFETKWFAAYNRKSSIESTGSKQRSTTTQTHSQNQSILKHSETRHKKEPSHIQTPKASDSKNVSQYGSKLQLKKQSDMESNNEIGTADEALRRVPSTNVNIADKSVGTDLSTTAKSASFHKSHTVIHEELKSLTDNISKVFLSPHDRAMSSRFDVATHPVRKKKSGVSTKLKTYFMQVCIMNTGSTFGFGENMRDRRIVALKPVTCMLIPKIWLLQHNTADIWTRLQYYLQKKIPSKRCLFEEFVKQQEWEEYRKQIVQDVVSRSNSVNYTSVHDVPYSIRLEEMLGV